MRNIQSENCIDTSVSSWILRTAVQSDCWLCSFSLYVSLSLSLSSFPPSLLHFSRWYYSSLCALAVVFHCCERMQIAIPLSGPSINFNRINSSAVIVFCASQKTLYSWAASRFAPLRTISGSYERLPVVTLLASIGSSPAPIARSCLKIGLNEPWARYNGRAIDHFIGNYRRCFSSDVGELCQKKKKEKKMEGKKDNVTNLGK